MNAMKRSEVHRKEKREKEQAKLKRRMQIRKDEKEKGGVGEERKKVRVTVGSLRSRLMTRKDWRRISRGRSTTRVSTIRALTSPPTQKLCRPLPNEQPKRPDA